MEVKSQTFERDTLLSWALADSVSLGHQKGVSEQSEGVSVEN